MMESVSIFDAKLHHIFIVIEVFITIVFTVEYALRIITLRNKKAYIFSFFGIIDFLAILPFYLSLFFPITKYFLILRLDVYKRQPQLIVGLQIVRTQNDRCRR